MLQIFKLSIFLYLIGYAACSKPPNVLLLFVDDMGYGDLGCQGNNTVDTPNIDKLAADGIRFTQWLSADSICTPSRGALLTGRLPIRLGISSGVYYKRVFQPLSPGGLPFEEHTLAEALKERGFRTHLSGKWHLGIGKNREYLPQAHGFDHYYGMGITNVKSCMPGEKIHKQDTLHQYVWDNTRNIWLSLLSIFLGSQVFGLIGSRCMFLGFMFVFVVFFVVVAIIERATLLSPTMCILYKDQDIVQQPVVLHNLTQRITEDASQFVESSVQSQDPFFLFLSYHKMHTALFSNEEFKLVDEKLHPEYKYISNLRELDWSVGHMIDKLKELGVYENTIIWFTSDNGPFLERGHEGGSKSFITTDEAGNEIIKTLRGGKATIWEGGFRVPGIAVYKDRFPAGSVTDEPVSSMDIFPTSLRLIDEAMEGQESYTYRVDKPHTLLDGKDITDMIDSLQTDNNIPSPHAEMVHYCGETLSAVRLEGRYKAYLFTPVYSEEELETCSKQTACQCQGSHVTEHDPPLLFDLKQDLEERHPLTHDNFSGYADLQKKVADAISRHMDLERSYPHRVNQMDYFQKVDLYPEVCCNFPSCECNNDPYSK